MGSKLTRDKRHGPENRFSMKLHKDKIKNQRTSYFIVIEDRVQEEKTVCDTCYFPLLLEQKSIFEVSARIYHLSLGIIHVRIWANTIKIVNTYVRESYQCLAILRQLN